MSRKNKGKTTPQKQISDNSIAEAYDRIDDGKNDFWYRLGQKTGGPLYLGLILWLDNWLRDQKVIFSEPGGKIPYQVLKMLNYRNIEYLNLKDDSFIKAAAERDDEILFFDFGWEGSAQISLEQRMKEADCETVCKFLYFGILNTEKSRNRLHGKSYDTYAFNYFTNHNLQRIIEKSPAVCELFFTGLPDPEDEKQLIQGISDYLEKELPKAKQSGETLPAHIAMAELDCLLSSPTAEEAQMIGDLPIPIVLDSEEEADEGMKTARIASLSKEQSDIEAGELTVWPRGLLARTDIPEKQKKKIASRYGIVYPQTEDSGYHLEDEASLRNYSRWMQLREKHAEKTVDLKYKPFFSVVIPVYNTKTEQLKAAIDSVLAQTYKHFELILVDDHSSWSNVVPVLRAYENHSAVRVIYRKENGHISAATNDGLRIAKGDFIAFMDCDDLITENALYEVALKLNENPELDFIYSDEDKITEDGKIRHFPFFKPEWSPDLFWSMMYTNHLGVYRASIIKELGGLRSEYNGSQDYDLTLRFLEKTENSRIGHIAKVLYHWRERKESAAYKSEAKNYAVIAAKKAKEDALFRRKIDGFVEFIPGISQYRIVYNVTGTPLVSIIIPSKDHPDVLFQCIDSLQKLTAYQNYEIIVVDNGSTDENRETIENYLNQEHIRYLYGQYRFNFSQMCNTGAAAANGDYLLFLNDDIEIISGNWLERMLGQAQQSHTGAVGTKLLFPESTIIQHAGVSNISEGPSHNFLQLDDKNTYSFDLNWLDYDCSAVTAACMLVKRSIFEEVGGFDENLPVAYNDVDFCWKIYEAGYYNVVRNDAIAVHHESLSRGNDLADGTKLLRLRRERTRLVQRHQLFKDGDPFLNPNLHMYASILDVKNQRDEIELTSKPEGKKAGYASLDIVWRASDQLMIQGWSYIPELKNNDKLKRRLILEDPFGNCFQSDLEYVYRPDVMKVMKRDDLLNSGFACYIDPEIIRTDIMSYRLSVLSEDPEGNIYITKIAKPTGITASSGTDQITNYNPCVSTGKYIAPKRADMDNMYFTLDMCEEQNEALIIRGWGYCEGNRHYLYKPFIVLRDENGIARKFEAERQMRLDVANELPYVHFLLNAGFRCVINPEEIPFGHSYDVLIRMINQLDPSDIREWNFDRQFNRFTDSKREKRIQELQTRENSEIELTNELLIINSQKTKTIELLLSQLNEKNKTINQLTRKYEKQTQEANVQSEQLARLTLERDAQSEQLANLKLERDAQSEQLANLKLERDAQSEQLTGLTLERDAKSEQLANMTLERDELLQRAEKAEEAFGIISNSTIWQITAPVRKILDLGKSSVSR